MLGLPLSIDGFHPLVVPVSAKDEEQKRIGERFSK